MDDFEEKLNSILSSPETMGQIMALADSISGKSSDTAPTASETSQPLAEGATGAGGGSPLSLLSSLDPKLLQKATTLLGEYTRGNDEKVALLNAMRPFLSEERRPKLDKALQIARLARVIRAAFQEFGRDRFV